MYRDIRLEFSSSLSEEVIKYVDHSFVILHQDLEKEVDKEIGTGNLLCFSAKHYPPAYIREQCDALTLDNYQTMNAVRIFYDESEAEDYEFSKTLGLDVSEMEEEESADTEMTKLLAEAALSQGVEFQPVDYDENTINVYGNLALLSDIKIVEKYRHCGYGKQAMGELADYCMALGMDFILLKPFPTETEEFEDEEGNLDDRVTADKVNELLNFYEPMGYKRTVGRSEGIYLVKKL
ncbi:MAG: hypothetical protein LRY73_11465 [Bacillus sp. (in: Bacteria)]|nr:hypothetical protein [Bacillus sp. (in: firmicutes)]